MEEANGALHSTHNNTTTEFFTNEDLKDLLGWKLGNYFVEITCGCPSSLGFGDFLSVVCHCFPGPHHFPEARPKQSKKMEK